MINGGSARAEIIPHIDDIGVTLGSVVAMDELAGAGFVMSGSLMAPCPWFPAVAELAARRPELDLGLHLTLNSESARMRWRPLSTTSHYSGLMDDDGFMWPQVSALRAHADEAAVEDELETQITVALAAGIRITHLDHHIGAAFAPEFAEVTLGVARRHRLPVLVPGDPAAYAGALDWGPADLEVLVGLRDDLVADGGIPVDQFLMGLSFQNEDPSTVYHRFMRQSTGLSFFSMHCNTPGEVSVVHPNDAAWRIAEYEWLREGPPEIPHDLELVDFRKIGSRWNWN